MPLREHWNGFRQKVLEFNVFYPTAHVICLAWIDNDVVCEGTNEMKNIALELIKKYKDLLTLCMLCKPQPVFPEHAKDINSGNVSGSNHSSQHGHDDAPQNKTNLPDTIQMAITDYPANLTKPNPAKSRKALPALDEKEMTRIDITAPTPKAKDLAILEHNVETINCETVALENEQNVDTTHSETLVLEIEQNVDTTHSETLVLENEQNVDTTHSETVVLEGEQIAQTSHSITMVLEGEQNGKTTHGETVVLEKCSTSENIQSTNIMKFVLIPVMPVVVNNPTTKTTGGDAKKKPKTSVKSTGTLTPFKGNMSDLQLIGNKDKAKNNPPKNVTAASTTLNGNMTDKQIIGKKDKAIKNQTNNNTTAQILLNKNIWTIQTTGSNYIYKVKRKYRDIQPCETSVASTSSSLLDVNNLAMQTTGSEMKKIDNLPENEETLNSLRENMSAIQAEDTDMTVDDYNYNPNINSTIIPTQLKANEFTMKTRSGVKEKYKQTINSTTTSSPFSVNTDNEVKEKYIHNKGPTDMVTRSGRSGVKNSVIPVTDNSIMEEYTHNKAPTVMATRSRRSETNTSVIQEDNGIMEGYTHYNAPIVTVTQSSQSVLKNTVIPATDSINMEGFTQNNTSTIMATRSNSSGMTNSIPATDSIIKDGYTHNNAPTIMATTSNSSGMTNSIPATDHIIKDGYTHNNAPTAMATRSGQSGVKALFQLQTVLTMMAILIMMTQLQLQKKKSQFCQLKILLKLNFQTKMRLWSQWKHMKQSMQLLILVIVIRLGSRWKHVR